MDNKINISFIISIAIAIMFLLGTPVLSPITVHAADSFVPHVNTGPADFYATAEGENSLLFSTSQGAYYLNSYTETYTNINPRTTTWYSYEFLAYNIGSRPVVNSVNFNYFQGDYTYNYNGTDYHVYYAVYPCSFNDVDYVDPSRTDRTYLQSVSGTKVFNSFNNHNSAIALTKFFLFGVGNFDYDLPAQDVPDSDLDIHGLDCVVLNDQQASVQVAESMKNIWDRNISALYSFIFDSPKDYISKGIENTGTQFVKNYVPGVSLLWDSPAVVMQSEALTVENPVLYTIWIDGKTDIKYNSSIDAIKNFFNGTSVGSCAYSKLQIHDNMIISNPYHTYYYNTNQGLETILDYISNNTQFTRPTETDDYQNICVTTTISRIYIQAHKTDPETGDNRYGAITYVDLSNGIPTVYEGVTEDNIDDIPASDPDDGTTTDVSQPFTVSGNDLVYDDPVRQANLGETGGGGFIVPVDGFLSAGLALIQAILELIKMWFLLKLVPILTLGFTGHI